jgi:putative ABC transport system permease protein
MAAALVIAVGTVTAVGFSTDRVAQAMRLGATELLASDLLIASSNPIDPAWGRRARLHGLTTTRTLSFRSMTASADRFQLVEVKAVSPGYPLRGRLEVAETPFGLAHPTREIPSPGTVWVDGRLLSALGLRVGQTVQLGAAQFTVTKILAFEPDRGGELFHIAPRLLMHLADVPRTELVQPASRVTHRLLLAGNASAIARFRELLAGALQPGERIRGIDEASPQLRAALDRASQYLGLASLTSVLIAGVGLALAARRYAARHADSVAILRSLGASRRWLTQVFAAQVLALGLLASLAGCALGFAGEAVLSNLFAGLVFGDLPPPSWKSIPIGLATGLGTLLGFALPPLLKLRAIAPVLVLQQNADDFRPPIGASYAGVILLLVGLGYQLGLEPSLAGSVLGGTMAVTILLALSARLLVKGLTGFRRRVGVAWRFGLANVARRPQESVLQITVLGVGMLVLLVLTFVRTDLLSAWQTRLPFDAPNFFLINVQPDTVDAVKRHLAQHGLSPPALYPMVRGRLRQINGRSIVPDEYPDPRAKRLATRDFNLSWSDRLQTSNQVVQGQWWTKSDRGVPAFSVDQGLAETLGIRVGDTLSFDVAGQSVGGEVVSLRSVAWDTFQVNFFVLLPPGVLNDAPATYISSFYLPPSQRRVLRDLVRAFSGITVLDVDALLEKARSIVAQAVSAVGYVFLFTLFAGVSVLFAAIQATLDERKVEAAILRTLGAGRNQVILGVLSEFVILGLLAGFVATLGATALSAWLARAVFELDTHLDPWLGLVGILGGAAGTGLAGFLGTRSVLATPPSASLRAA